MKKLLIILIVLFFACHKKIEQPPVKQINVGYVKNVVLLSKLISAESIGEPYEAKLYSGSVVLNRMNDCKFPSTLHGVIYQKDQFSQAISSRYFRIDTSTPEGRDCIKAAIYLLANGSVLPKNVLAFHNPNKAKNIKHVEKMKNNFYKRKGSHEFFYL